MSYNTEVSPYVLEGPVADQPDANTVKIGDFYFDRATNILYVCDLATSPATGQAWYPVVNGAPGALGANLLKFSALLVPEVEGGLIAATTVADSGLAAVVAPQAFLMEYPIEVLTHAVRLSTRLVLPAQGVLPGGTTVTIQLFKDGVGTALSIDYVAGDPVQKTVTGNITVNPGERLSLVAASDAAVNLELALTATVNLA